MTGYDVFAIVVILFSVAAGWVRGGVREVITLLSATLAALVALIALPWTAVVTRAFVDPEWAGSILAAVLTFFVVYFGLRGLRPHLRHHMVLFGPRYRALIREIFNGPDVADDFSLYLHSPCITDPSLAPPGMGSGLRVWHKPMKSQGMSLVPWWMSW